MLELCGVEAFEDDADDQSQDVSNEKKKASGAYQEFLQFLELGCSGSPIQGYPTVVIILSTIPPSVRLLFFLDIVSLTILIRYFSIHLNWPYRLFFPLSGLLSMVVR